MKIENDTDDIPTQMGILTYNYLASLAGAGLFLWVLSLFWGEYILLDIKDLTGSVSAEGLGRVWFIFVWAFCVTLLLGLLKRNSQRATMSRAKGIAVGTWVSLNAGFFEELEYRWLRFFTGMIILPFLNFITFGFVQWLYTSVLVPVASTFTFQALDEQLYDPRSWVLGAALVLASIKFRDAHGHLGALGMINAWFIGMVLFWLMFNYGLWTAIIAHIVYDILVFGTAALVAKQSKPALGF